MMRWDLTDDLSEASRAALDVTPCPACGAFGLRLKLRLVANPRASVSGSTPKVAAAAVPHLVCACGWAKATRQ